MSEFKQRIPKESVNYTNEHPIKDYIAMVVGIIVIIGVLLVSLDFIVGLGVDRITFEQESRWFSKVNRDSAQGLFGKEDSLKAKNSAREEKLHELLEKLWLPFGEGKTVHFKVGIMPQKELNAFTGIGGQFYFTDGLMDKNLSLNGLGFVACHELGHFFHRHVLKASARGLLMNLLLKFIGLGGVGETLIDTSSEIFSLKFSRDAERAADSFALDCQQKFFGHVNGLDEFFINIQKNEGMAVSFLSSHPKMQERIEELKLQAVKKGYSLEGELSSISSFFDESND